MPLDIDNINRETNISEDEELRDMKMRARLRAFSREEIAAGPQGAGTHRLHKISANELDHMLNSEINNIRAYAPNVAQACQWVMPPALKEYWQASSQAYISDMMGTWVTEDNETWRHADGTERPDDTSDS